VGTTRTKDAPSQAMTRNSSSEVAWWTMMSGSAVTTWVSADRFGLCLNSKSPRARESAKLPVQTSEREFPP
jgi:hypothetical protein